jgi:hypothetical protein
VSLRLSDELRLSRTCGPVIPPLHGPEYLYARLSNVQLVQHSTFSAQYSNATMAAQQPNYAAIGNHLQGLANEVVLLPNAVPAAPVTLLQVQNLIFQMQQNIQQQIQQLENRLVARSVVSFCVLTLVLIFLCTVSIISPFSSIIPGCPTHPLFNTLLASSKTSCL